MSYPNAALLAALYDSYVKWADPCAAFVKSLENRYFNQVFKTFEYCIPITGTKVPSRPVAEATTCWRAGPRASSSTVRAWEAAVFLLAVERDGVDLDSCRLLDRWGFSGTGGCPIASPALIASDRAPSSVSSGPIRLRKRRRSRSGGPCS